MSKTRHMESRMSQRGITQEMVSVAMQFGTPIQDKTVLDSQTARLFLMEMERMKKTVKKILDKGGLVVVSAEEHLITAYNLDSYKKY